MQLRPYPLTPDACLTLHLPPGAIVRATGIYAGLPTIWVELTPVKVSKLVPRTFAVVGCEPDTVPAGGVFVGATSDLGGQRWWFVYEVSEPQ
jgi:hypothetical protein